MDEHLTDGSLRSFLNGDDRSPFNRVVTAHLIRGCPRCARVLGGALRPRRGADRDGQVLQQATLETLRRAPAVEREVTRAEVLFAELGAHPPGRQLTLIQSRPALQIPPLVELYMRACRQHLSDDIQRALELAGLAVAASETLCPESYGRMVVNDFRSRALIELANTQRRASDFRTASKTLRGAAEVFEFGACDPMTEAKILETRAMLLLDQGFHPEALKRLRRAFAIYRDIGDYHRCGTNLVRQAQVHEIAGEPLAGVKLLHQSCALIDTSYEPRWALAIYHNLVVCHATAGQTQEAMAYLEDARPFHERLGKPADLLRLRWTEGRILAQQEKLAAAEECFTEAVDGFTGLGLPFEAAEVSLELALIYVEQERTASLRSLTEGALPIFQSLELSREALAAFAFFQRAVAAETATVGIVRRLGTLLRRQGSRPQGLLRAPLSTAGG